MSGLKQLIQEIHRRSLWQVLGVYLVGSWLTLQVVDTLAGALNLPGWAPPLALQEAGRYEEALIWFGSFGEHSVYSLPYVAPSHLWRARILEQLERPAEASHHDQRFLELWAGADPELEPLVEEAKARVDELGAG